MITCKICGNQANNRIFVVKEMMLGLKEEHEYVECSECGCLQIRNIPSNLQKYYPSGYYSLEAKGESDIIQNSFLKSIKRRLKHRLLDYYLQKNRLVTRLFSSRYGDNYPWIKKNTINSSTRILDVGCGWGDLLLRMRRDGFKSLTGIDSFIDQDIHYQCGVTVYKRPITEFTGKYDMVMMHHSFEHMDQPLQVLVKIYSLLSDNGFVIIRIPVMGGFAWKKYGVNWVQLDAPRHFFLHTVKSLKILCDQSGFEISDFVYDSNALQFIGSEKYLRNISLTEKANIFSRKSIRELTKEAVRLNAANDGDQACFYLYKKGDISAN